MAERIRILSIDGGGIRGIIPGVALAAMEAMAGRPIHELFDLVAGTSTGGILALGLTCPATDDPTRARYSAAEMVALYEDHGAEIFRRPSYRELPGLGLLTDMLEERYPAGPIERILEEFFGDTRLRDVLCDVIVPAYEIERRVPFFFKSRRARVDDDYDYPIRDVARATSAAPTYFEPHKIVVDGGYYSLIDGGVYANNPTMCAVAEALAVAREGAVGATDVAGNAAVEAAGNAADGEPGSAGVEEPGDSRGPATSPELVVVSLGTGEHTRRIPHDDAVGYGLVQWAPRLLSVMMDGNSDTVRYQATRAVPDDRHFRFQVTLDAASDDLDNTSPQNLRALRLAGEAMAGENRARLETAVALLAG